MENKKFIQLLFIFLVSLGLTESAPAAEDSEFVQKAKDRYYHGGPDESDLKVQQKLTPTEKNKNLDNEESDEGF